MSIENKILEIAENNEKIYDKLCTGEKTSDGGLVFGDIENNKAGLNAATFGSKNKAIGEGSFATGARKDVSGAPDDITDDSEYWRYNEAYGTGSMASGMGAVAYSRASKSLGYRTQAGYPSSKELSDARPEAKTQKDSNGNVIYPAENVAQAAVAIGADTISVGKHSLAGGYRSIASGENAIAFGSQCTSTNKGSVAMGFGAEATGEISIALGDNTKANGLRGFAAGVATEANGNYSTAFGHTSKANGNHSFAAGSANVSSGIAAVALGTTNKAEASASIALGYNNTATGTYSAALGCCIKAEHAYMLAAGKFNKTPDSSALFAIGNGSSDTNRTNAFEVYTTGNVKYQNEISSSNGADYAEFFEWSDGNLNNEDRIGLAVCLDGEKIRLAQADDDVLGIISGTAAVLGDSAFMHWKNKYLTDEYGRMLYDMVEEFTEEEDPETGEIKTVSVGFFPQPRLNPDYDPETTYIPREDRPEWDKVGMMGKLYVRDDGTCVSGGYGCVGKDGVLTHSETTTNIRVMKRTSDNIVLALLK